MAGPGNVQIGLYAEPVRCPRPPLCEADPRPPRHGPDGFIAARSEIAPKLANGGSGFLGNRTGVKNENGIPSWRDGGQIIVAKFR